MISTQPVPKVEPGPFCSQAMMNVLRNFGKRGLSPFSRACDVRQIIGLTARPIAKEV